ncbi:MAG: hypothetical protein K2P21_06170 [Lachnospiraceae bacterium]|nr:hypothetical protein [Lachnospiraceae bacterium]
MGNFDDLSMAVASFGGNNKVIFDDLEKPSIMVGIPKMKYQDIITGGSENTVGVFKVDGVEREMIYISKYLNVVVNDRAYSLPMKDPKTFIDFDTAVAACRKKGEGWGLTPNAFFSAIMLWCNRNSFLPRGNTEYGRCYEKKFERGVNTYIDGSHGGGRTATGSGPATWYHDGSPAGIADLCGNVYEWVAGLRIVNGEIQVIPCGNSMKSDCDMSAESTEWKAISSSSSGSLVNPGTAGTLHYDIASGKIFIGASTNYTFVNSLEFSKMAVANGLYSSIILRENGLIKDTADIYPTSGHKHYVNSDGERLAARGSDFSDAESGGVGSLYLDYIRTRAGKNVGFRSVYDEKLANGNE